MKDKKFWPFISARVATNLENSGNLKNCENLRENSGKFELLYKNLENSGKMKNMWHDHLQNAFHQIFLSWAAQGKVKNTLEISGKTQGI